MRRSTIVLLAVAAFIVGAAAALAVFPAARERVLPDAVRNVGAAAIGGPFTLVDQTGRTVTEKDFHGRVMLVYFGFTNCPDVCPAALQVMDAARERLGAQANRVASVFVTVDPERDTPAVLSDYLTSFPGTIGLTGSVEAVRQAAAAYRVYFKKSKDDGSSASYTVDHTSIIYLMGPDGRFISHFTHASSVDSIAAKLATLL